MDLKLDIDEDCPRRLVIFPSGQIVAFGGDDGTLTCFDAATQKVRTIKQYDDAAVRALAVSSDGTRVAVGFDNGSTRIYRYDDYINNDNNNDNDNKNHHPFVPPPKGENNKDEDDDNDDNFGGNGFLSQPDIGMDDDDDEEAMEGGRLWAGPQMEGAIRDLMFLPNSHWLAVAAESGLCIVNAHSADTMTNRYLQHQVEQEHDACGIRGVAVTTGGNGKGNDNHQVLMASLGMDGRLCVWQVSSLEKLPSVDAKVPCFRDQNRCVPIKDIGELNGADSADRSCFPYWVKPGVLALPGKAHVQLRAVNVLNDSLIVEDVEPKVANDDPSKGHIESIVALTSVDDHVVSSGRDGRVILWKLQEDNVSVVVKVQLLSFRVLLLTFLFLLLLLRTACRQHNLWRVCSNTSPFQPVCIGMKNLMFSTWHAPTENWKWFLTWTRNLLRKRLPATAWARKITTAKPTRRKSVLVGWIVVLVPTV